MRFPHALFSCLLLTSGLLLMGAIHPFHISITEAEVVLNDDGVKVLQVALRVSPDDLEKALERRSRRRLTLETTKDIDHLIVEYLDDVFQIRHPAPDEDSKPTPLEPCPEPVAGHDDPQSESPTPPSSHPDAKKKDKTSIIRWVGKEIDVRYAWLYFEICLPEKGLKGLEFSNRIFFDIEPDQDNTVNLKDGNWKPSLRFNRNETWKTLKKAEAPTDPR
ncbi:MAG: hypothetical protein O7G85_06575 [Planctomycetota bacterium]|nr:hypothetical protein [Planctomycetota bacterium]